MQTQKTPVHFFTCTKLEVYFKPIHLAHSLCANFKFSLKQEWLAAW